MLLNRLAAACGLLLVASSVDAAVLFENPFDSRAYGNCKFQCFGYIGAENFTLAAPATVGLLTFETISKQVRDDTGLSVTWGIRADDSGDPGTELAFGTLTPAVTFLGVTDDFDHLLFTLDIPDVALTAGDYWVTFAVTPSGAQTHFWAATDLGDAVSAFSSNGGATWAKPYLGPSEGYVAMVFSVQGPPSEIPGPATLPLLAAALAGLMLRRRRRSA